jgi:drug/metabolite transporter (DMT)-like permease
MGLEWLVLALAAAVLNGLSTLAAKPSADRLGPSFMGLGAILAEGVAFGVAGLVLSREPMSAGVSVVVAAVSAGVLGAVGYLFFFAGMRRGSVGLVGTISAAAPVLTVILSVSFLGEAVGGFGVLGIAMTVACVLLLAVEPRRRSADRRAAVALSLGGFLTWGLWGFLVKASVDTLGEGNLFLLLAPAYLGVAAVAAILWRKTAVPRGEPSQRLWALGFFVFLSGAVAAIVLTIAYDLGPAALVAPVAGTYPVIATLGAGAMLREKLEWRIGVALALFVVGIGLLSAV